VVGFEGDLSLIGLFIVVRHFSKVCKTDESVLEGLPERDSFHVIRGPVKKLVCIIIGEQHFDKGNKMTASTEVGRHFLRTITLF